jgi:hypothetical protein
MIATEHRLVRVFVSSSFRDMHAEREELVKHIFPQLRKQCEQRGVLWADVDLRWGVTEQRKTDGQVLPICLTEIERCRPFFIGLLGQRLGKAVGSMHPDILRRWPWLNGYQDASLTEIEMLHGALRDPTVAQSAVFYLRDPSYLDRLLPDSNPSDFRCDDDEQAERLRQLKTVIRNSGLSVRDDYADPTAFGQLVLRDFSKIVDLWYPANLRSTSLDRDNSDHDFYAKSRSRAYVHRHTDFERLDQHAAGQGPPLVVTGESGIGKSALLANWAADYRARYADQLVFMHFIGATSQSTDWANMVRRIMGEFKRRLSVGEDIPSEPDALRVAFANSLFRAAAKGIVVLVLDGLNQLEDREGAQDLAWLPRKLPVTLRLVASTLPGRALVEIKRRGWEDFSVQPLTFLERHQVIHDYLAQYAKELGSTQIERIAVAAQTANPLYLRMLLEELRVFGSHEELEGWISAYLLAQDVPELCDRILARYERDYGRDGRGSVALAFVLIWAARRGLSESELLELLGEAGWPLPHVFWSELRLAAEESLIERAGLIGFAHQYMREAVARRYHLADHLLSDVIHAQLTSYFSSRFSYGSREIDELPWHLAQTGSWKNLHRLLTMPHFFLAAWERSEVDVKRYWAQIEAHSAFRLVDFAKGALENVEEHPEVASRVAVLLRDKGYLTEALMMQRRVVETSKQAGDDMALQYSLNQLGITLNERHGSVLI